MDLFAVPVTAVILFPTDEVVLTVEEKREGVAEKEHDVGDREDQRIVSDSTLAEGAHFSRNSNEDDS